MRFTVPVFTSGIFGRGNGQSHSVLVHGRSRAGKSCVQRSHGERPSNASACIPAALPHQVLLAEHARRARARGAREVARLQVSAPTAAASSRERATWCGTAGWCTRGGATTSARTAAAASARRATCDGTARPSTRGARGHACQRGTRQRARMIAPVTC